MHRRKKGLKLGPVHPETRQGGMAPYAIAISGCVIGGLLHTWTPPGHLTALTHPPIPIAHPIDGT